MATDNTDILLDENGDDQIKGGDFAVGDGTLDDCFIIFKLNTAALKQDPILAPNLVSMMNSTASNDDMKRAISLNLQRDNKKYKKLAVKNGIIDFEL